MNAALRPLLPLRERAGVRREGAAIVIAAGGTGGHMFPAEALAAELTSRGYRVALMTDARTQPGKVFTERHVLSGAGIAGRGLARGVKAIGALTIGAVQARQLMKRIKPAVLVGFGGYPSVAPIAASRLTRPRPAIVLHEQNAVLGRANRALSRVADVLATSFATTLRVPHKQRVELTGNPVRPALHASPYQPDGPLLILGGSLGARVFSDVVPAAIALLPEATRRRVIQQCRPEDIARVETAYAKLGVEARLAPFFPDIADLLRDAALVIARAGASTVAELAVVGRPAILVPLPGAIDDHQSVNACALDGAVVIAQPDFTAERLAAELLALLADPARHIAAASRIAACGRADAAVRLADLVEMEMSR